MARRTTSGSQEERPSIQTDVADAKLVLGAADNVEKEIGPIEIWVNVAFTSVFAPFDQIQPDEYKRVTEVSYLGYVYGTMAALKYMKARDRGTIVQVGSALAYRGIPLQSAYCGAKHAIQGFNEALRCELLHDESNVHVTMVQMPAVNTPQFSWVLSRLPRRAQPVRRSISRSWLPAALSSLLNTHNDANLGWAPRPWRRLPSMRLPLGCWTDISANRVFVPTNLGGPESSTHQSIFGTLPTDMTERTLARTASSTTNLMAMTRSSGSRIITD